MMDFNSISVPVVTGLSHAQIEKEALCFLTQTSRGVLERPSATPVLQIFENKMDLLGFSVLVGKNVRGLGGLTDITNKRIEISSSTYAKLEKGEPQARFTVAHEFGHAFLHGRQNISMVFARRAHLRAFEDPEWQANNFASAVLMPQKTMLMLYLHQRMTVETVMKIYNVSWSAATRRVHKLNKIFSSHAGGCL